MSTPSAQRYDTLDKQFINGNWKAGSSGKTAKDVNPFSGKELVEIALADKTDVDEAMRAAETAQRDWAMTPPAERADIIRKAADIFTRRKEEIIEWLMVESGSSYLKSEIEWATARNITLESASYPSRMHGRLLSANRNGTESRIYRLPVGVIQVISPWNFPLHLSMRSIVAAIALGNTVVHKPSGDTPITGGLLIAKILEEAGLPAGVFNVLVGSSGEIGDYVVLHETPRFVSFTGSTKVGKRLASLASEGPMLKRVALELGGNSPCVVLDDANLEDAVNGAIFGKFLHQGQICMAINRIIVDAKIYDQFVDKFTAHAAKLPCGDPEDKKTVIGPVINKQQADQMAAIIEKARSEGAKETLSGKIDNLMVTPFVFADVDPGASLSMQETFGPVACIIKANGEEEALKIANMTNYGLSSCVFSSDLERAAKFAQKVQAGMTHINDTPVADVANAPFGGEKNSGIGRFNGDWILEEMTTLHWITVREKPAPYAF